MAYYNPENQDRYYNPVDKQQTEQVIPHDYEESPSPEPGNSIVKTVGSILGGMFVFGVGTALVRGGGSKLFSSTIKGISAISKIDPVKLNKPVAALTKFISPITRGAAKVVESAEGRNVTLKHLLKGIPKVKDIVTKYDQVVKEPRNIYKQYLRSIKSAEITLKKEGRFNAFELQKEKLRNFWKKDKLSQRVTGSVEKWGTEYLKTLPAYYITDRIINAKGYAGEKPSILNLPGTALDFAKFSFKMAPYDIAFGTAFKTLGLAKYGVTAATAKILKPFKPQIEKTLDKVASKISSGNVLKAWTNIRRNVEAGSTALKNVNLDISERFRSHFVGRTESRAYYKRPQSFFDPKYLKSTWEGIKRDYSTQLKNITRRDRNNGISVGISSYRGKEGSNALIDKHRTTFKLSTKDTWLAEFVKFTQRLYENQHVDGVRFESPISMGQIRSKYKSQLRPHNISILGSVIGKKLATRGASPYKNKYTQIFNRVKELRVWDSKELKNIEDAFYKSTFGKDIFQSSSNASKIADYSHFNPVNLLKSIPRLFQKFSVKVPFRKERIRPYDFIAGETLFGKGARNRSFGAEESYYIGPDKNTRKFLKNYDDRSMMAFVNDEFFYFDPDKKSFRGLDSSNDKKYWLRPSAVGSRISQIQARENAYYNSGFKDIIDNPNRYSRKTFRGTLERVAKNQEIGAGYGKTESLYSRIKGWTEGKLFGVRQDINKAYNDINDKNLMEKLYTGLENFNYGQHPTQILKGALETSRDNAAHYILDDRTLRLLADRSKMSIKVFGKKFENVADFMQKESNVINYWKENITTAPKKVAHIIERYNLGEKHALSEVVTYPTIGKALTGMEELKISALENIMKAHVAGSSDYKKVFGAGDGFIKELSNRTGFSKIALTAINNFGLNIELDNIMNIHKITNKMTTTPDQLTSFTKHFRNKLKEFEHAELMKLNVFLSEMTGPRKATDRLLSINKSLQAQIDNTPFVAIEKSFRGVAGTSFKYISERLADMGGFFGLGMDLTKHVGVGGQVGYWTKRVLQFSALAGAYNIADTFFDSNPLFNNTFLDEGITVAFAEQLAKARLATAKVADLTGVTKTAQYMEGLMPGSTTFIPGAVLGGFMGGPMGAVIGGFANRAIGTYFNYDSTRTFEQLKDVYAGREKIAVRSNRAWEISKTPYEGQKINYYRPSWFHLLKSQYKNNPVLYGGKLESLLLTKPWAGIGFNPLGVLLDPYRLEKKQYFDRPFPITSPAGVDIPLIGPAFSATIGKIIKPVKMMHPQELQDSYNGIPGGMWEEELKSNLLTRKAMDLNSESQIALRGGARKPISPYDAYTAFGNQIYNMTEAGGLLGFLSENTILQGGIGEGREVLDAAGRMSSLKRQYWDMELGGGFFASEFWRRMIPKEKAEIEYRNPLTNNMPQWLPGFQSKYFLNFNKGDPYSSIPLGEARLPGFGLESVRNIKYTFPARASMLGKDLPVMISYMLGLGQEKSIKEQDILEEGTAMHRAIQHNLAESNLLIKAESEVFNVQHDVTGHVDAIIADGTGGGGKRAVEIKTINAKGFDTLRAPKKVHISQLNFYLSELGMKTGSLVYVNRDDPSQVKSFTTYFSKNLLERDIIKLEQARQIASNLLRQGVRGQNIGEAYSHLDRLEVLGDVSPWSQEYKNELKIVNSQRKAGLFSQDEIRKIETIRKHRTNVMRRHDFYPRRFSIDQLMDPDPTYTQMAVNENIKAAAEYSLPERVAGNIWEQFTHANLPFIKKFFNYKTPLEHYKENVMYGSTKSFWTKPYESFIDPAIRGMVGQTDPFGGATKFAVPGFLVGGPVGVIGAGAVGALYGGIRGLTKNISSPYIPGNISKQREISQYFDRIQFEKYKRLYDATGNDEYMEEMQKTMTGYKSLIGGQKLSNLFKAVSRPEKDYLEGFIKTTNPDERKEILNLIPEGLGEELRKKWKMGDNIESGFEKNEEYFRTHKLPKASDPFWNVHLPVSDFQVQTMKMEGLDAHDVGLGWYDQERRIKNSPFRINPININEPEVIPIDISKGKLYYSIQTILRNNKVVGDVSIIPTGNGSDGVNITINASVDRKKEILQTIRGR